MKKSYTIKDLIFLFLGHITFGGLFAPQWLAQLVYFWYPVT